MEAAARLLPRRTHRREEAVARELERLRPLGETYLARRFGGQLPRADAEDAVSEVIVRLHRRIAAGSPPRNLRAAFFTSVRNAAIDQFRWRQARPTVPLDHAEESPTPTPTPIELAEAHEDGARLHDALARMRPNYREALVLRFGAGLTVPEISDRLGISLPAAKKLLLRATAQARQRIEALDAHEFCPEMRDAARRALFDREAAGIADEAERRELRAHLRHCGSCKAFLAGLHHDLHELGGGAILGLAAGDPLTHSGGLISHLGNLLAHAATIPHAAAARLRLAAYKAGGALPGSDAGSAGLLNAGAQKAIALCGAPTATAATCLATGVIGPGLASAPDPAAGEASNPPPAISKPPPEPVAEEALPPPPAPESPTPSTSTPVAASSPSQPEPAAAPEPKPEPKPSPSREAGEQFGFESRASSQPPSETAAGRVEPAPEPTPTPAPERAPAPAPTSTSGGGGGGGGGGGQESFGFGG